MCMYMKQYSLNTDLPLSLLKKYNVNIIKCHSYAHCFIHFYICTISTVWIISLIIPISVQI